MSVLHPLRESLFLRDIPGSVVDQIDPISHHCDFRPGSVIFHEGTEHSYLYLIVRGHVRLDMSVPIRGRIPLMTLADGDLLGWSPLIGNSIMTSTATALDSVEIVRVYGPDLRRLCESDHEVGYYLMRQVAQSISQRLIATRLQLLDLFVDHVPAIDVNYGPGHVDEQC